MTFAVLPGRGTTSPVGDVRRTCPHRWAFTGAGLDGPVDDILGISVDDAAAGVVSLPVHDYLRNSFGAVQGGVMALLGRGGRWPRCWAPTTRFEGVPVVTDLQVAYLALGRVGPIVSRSRRRPGGDSSSGSAVVELLDRGADDRLTTVINARAAPASAPARAAPAPWAAGR